MVRNADLSATFTMLLASHMYSSASESYPVLIITRVLSICLLSTVMSVTSNFPELSIMDDSLPFILLQIMVGCGLPVALHVNVALLSCTTVTFIGGVTMTGATEEGRQET